MKLYVFEMNKEVLTNVFNRNNELQNKVLDDMIDSEMHWIGEKLDYFRGSLRDWSVGTDSYPYIYVKNAASFVDGVIAAQKSVPILLESDDDFIASIAQTIEKYENAEMYSDEYYNLENKVEQLAQQLADKIAAQFKSELDYCYGSKAQLEYFIEFYSDARLNKDSYIIVENNDFILYEDISYTKNYG